MNSLTSRLLLSATLVLLVFMGLTGSVLNQAFRSSAEKGLSDKLRIHIYGLLAVAESASGGLYLPSELPEPGFNQLGSGLYALITDAQETEIWRSQSALDLDISAQTVRRMVSTTDSGQGTFGLVDNGAGQPLYYYSFGVLWQGEGEKTTPFVFTTLQFTQPLEDEINSFRQSLWIWLGGAVVVLLIFQALIMAWGLSPLRRVADDLKSIESGQKDALEGTYPREIAGVTRNLNLLLASERQQREKYKSTMADLAHSLKTPLAILKGVTGAAASKSEGDRIGGIMATANDPLTEIMVTTNDPLTEIMATTNDHLTEIMVTIDEQVSRMDQIISYQLQKAVSSSASPIHRSVQVDPVLKKLVAALQKVYVERGVDYDLDVSPCMFHGDERDLMELLGNLLDNASKYGAGRVAVTIRQDADEKSMELVVEDNGPGIPDALYDSVLQRGIRVDSREAGQGIGLAVVADIVASYNGSITIDRSSLGGACIRVMV